MAKIDDARKAVIQAYFDPSDVITKDHMWDVIEAIQEAAQDHEHTATGGPSSGTGDAAEVDCPATTPVMYNVTMTNADSEYSQALPADTRKFLIKCRGAYALKVCFTNGQSGTTYVTVPSLMAYWEDLIMPSSLTLYFQCATAAQVAEIVAWS